MDKILDKLKKAELFLLDNYRSKKPKSAKAKQLRQEQLDKRKKKNRHVKRLNKKARVMSCVFMWTGLRFTCLK